MAGLLDFLSQAGLLGGQGAVYAGPGSMDFGAQDPGNQQPQLPAFLQALAQAQPMAQQPQQAPQQAPQQFMAQAPQQMPQATQQSPQSLPQYAQQDPRLQQGGRGLFRSLLEYGRPDLAQLEDARQQQGAMLKAMMAPKSQGGEGLSYPEAAFRIGNSKLQEDIYGNPKQAGSFEFPGGLKLPNMVGRGTNLGVPGMNGAPGGVDLGKMLQLGDQMQQRNAQIAAYGKNLEQTPDQKNAGAPDQTGIPGVGAGLPSVPGRGVSGLPQQNANPVLNYDANKKIQEQNIAAGQKRYEGINAQSSQYERDLKPYLDISKSILNDPNMYSGIGGNFALDMNRVKAAFGDKNAAVLQEALQKVTASSVLGQINNQRAQLEEAGGNSSRIFSQQVELVEKAAPALANTTAGNRFLVEVAQRMGDLASRVAQEARDYKQQHGTLDTGFDQHLANYMKQHPIFSQSEMTNPQLLAAPTVPPNSANDQQSFMTWAKGMGLKSGDPVRGPNGAIKVVP